MRICYTIHIPMCYGIIPLHYPSPHTVDPAAQTGKKRLKRIPNLYIFMGYKENSKASFVPKLKVNIIFISRDINVDKSPSGMALILTIRKAWRSTVIHIWT